MHKYLKKYKIYPKKYREKERKSSEVLKIKLCIDNILYTNYTRAMLIIPKNHEE